MKVIQSILFSKLRNEAHYQFLLVVYNLFVSFTAVKAIIPTVIFDKFVELLSKERNAIDVERASPLTEQLKASDSRIDSIITSIRLLVEVGLRSSDAIKVAAAKTLHKRMEDFGDIRDKPYEEESTAVQILTFDLRGKYKGESATVGIGDLLNELLQEEELFTGLFAQRNAEADRPKANTRTIRHDIEGVYRNMLVMIENDILVNGPAKTAEFSFQLNKQIKYFNEHSHHAPKSIEHAVVATVGDLPHTGKAVTPIPEVHFVEEGHPTVELTFTVDFTLTYRNNVNVGTADAIIHGKGAYKGLKTVTFNIVHATI
jgi:hypothetical protein